MKKHLLLMAAAAVAMTASAQTEAVLEDVTPVGYNFDRYEDGAIFKVHASGADHAGWSPKLGIYDPAVVAQDGHFTAFCRRGAAAENSEEKIAEDNKAITIRDFGGTLGKCLVINQAWSPLASDTDLGEQLYGEGNSPWASMGVGGCGSMCITFYNDATKIHHNWAGHSIRIRIVFDILRRGCHMKTQNADTGLSDAYAWGENAEGGWYAPAFEYNEATMGLVDHLKVPAKGSEFGRWVNEGTSVEEIPANPVLLTGLGKDPLDNKTHTCGDDTQYYMQLNRFMVYEWDVYMAADDHNLKVMFDFDNKNTTIVIKEIKFFNITNSMDLLEFPNPEDETNFTYGPNSYLDKRVKSWRYYTTKLDAEVEPQPGELVGKGTEADPYQITTPEHIEKMKDLVSADKATYFKLMNDIDMTGINHVPTVGYSNTDFGKTIHFDGNHHIISNLTSNWTSEDEIYYASLFGVFQGSVKDLGLVDVDLKSGLGVAGIGGYAGYGGVSTTIDNCFVTGKLESLTGYCAGIAGTNAAALTVTNCYAQVEVIGKTFAGGLIGRGRETITLNNCYVSGTVGSSESGVPVNLIASTDKANSASIALNGVAALNNGATENTNYGTTVSGNVTTDVNVVKTWSAFNEGKLFNGLPALNWQEGNGGVQFITEDFDANAPVEYYNLQGIRVENPANGLYIKRQGNKVAKVLVK